MRERQIINISKSEKPKLKMDEQNSKLPPNTTIWRNGGGTENNEKALYVSPKLSSVLVELEGHLAAGSIEIEQKDNKVEEGWMVDEIEREITIDLY